MKILIVSDSHRVNANLKTAINREKPDMLIHLGDIEDDEKTVALWAGAPKTPCIFIKGNCDRYSGSSELRDRAVFPLKGHKFYCCVKQGDEYVRKKLNLHLKFLLLQLKNLNRNPQNIYYHVLQKYFVQLL